MKIRLLTRMAGPAGVWQPGAVIDVGLEMARPLIEAGFAVVDPDQMIRSAGPETATAEPAEQAVVRQPRRRPRKGG